MDSDHNFINISSFKAKCISLLKKVRDTGVPLTVTLRGQPLVTVLPGAQKTDSRIFDGQRGSVEVIGQIVENDFSDDWESLS